MPRTWVCCACQAQNSDVDGECQYCECGGQDCKRDNCSGPGHPGLEPRSVVREENPKSVRSMCAENGCGERSGLDRMGFCRVHGAGGVK